MDRRSFFNGLTAGTPLSGIKPGDPAARLVNQTIPNVQTAVASIAPYSGSWGSVQLMHLLRRTTFGPRKSHVDVLQGKTMDEVVDMLLTAPASPPDPPLNYYNNSKYTDPYCSLGDTWVNAAYDNGTGNAYRVSSLKGWWIGLMLNQGISIVEKMTLFLQDHFVTDVETVKDARASYANNALLRQYALGNFKDLTHAVTKDVAMLRYLNGASNTAAAPDENYGRELQELFTIGKGPDSHYTEDDVKAAARVLTGWRVNNSTLTSYFSAGNHDSGDKQFSAFYNNTIIRGRSGANAGEQELSDLMDMIFATQECAKFICRCLYRFFVYYVIDDNVEQNVITSLANTFRSNNYELKPVLSQLLKSDHFYDTANIACMIKSPLDHCVGLARQANISFPTDLVGQYYMWNYLRQASADQAQDIYDQPNVAGWPAYYQEPEYYELWVNSDTLPKRNQYADTLTTSKIKAGGASISIDVIAFAAQFSNPGDPNQLISDVTSLLFAYTLTSDQVTFLKSILLSGQTSDHYWTDAWVAYQNSPTPTNKQIVQTRLQQFVGYMFDMAEYQLA